METLTASPAQRITLKSLKVAKNLSDESTAFTASVYVDGTIIGYAENRGNGSETLFIPKHNHDDRTVLAEALRDEDFMTFCETAIVRHNLTKARKAGRAVLIDDKSGNPLDIENILPQWYDVPAGRWSDESLRSLVDTMPGLALWNIETQTFEKVAA